MVRENFKQAAVDPNINLAPPGTLMWVGERGQEEFWESFRYCETRAAQLALRHDLRDALNRPAANVCRILVARVNREPLDDVLLRELQRTYPLAEVLQLLGPLCEIENYNRLETYRSKPIRWHEANQVLPGWLARCGATPHTEPVSSRSVAVVAATATAAEPLLDLAASAGVFAVWCRSGDAFRLRNAETVWWDDTATYDRTLESWQSRIDALTPAQPDRQVCHAWLVSAPNLEQCRAAYRAGVRLILTKPARIFSLLETLRRPIETEVHSGVTRAADTHRPWTQAA